MVQNVADLFRLKESTLELGMLSSEEFDKRVRPEREFNGVECVTELTISHACPRRGLDESCAREVKHHMVKNHIGQHALRPC